MCIVLSFFPSPFPSLPRSLCFFSATGPQNNGSLRSTRPPGLWVPVSTTPAEPWHRKVPETRGTRAKKLHLDEIYRSVPAMPPGKERKAGRQNRSIRGRPGRARFLHFRASVTRAWSGMTGVVNSLKLNVCRHVPTGFAS